MSLNDRFLTPDASFEQAQTKFRTVALELLARLVPPHYEPFSPMPDIVLVRTPHFHPDKDSPVLDSYDAHLNRFVESYEVLMHLNSFLTYGQIRHSLACYIATAWLQRHRNIGFSELCSDGLFRYKRDERNSIDALVNHLVSTAPLLSNSNRSLLSSASNAGNVSVPQYDRASGGRAPSFSEPSSYQSEVRALSDYQTMTPPGFVCPDYRFMATYSIHCRSQSGQPVPYRPHSPSELALQKLCFVIWDMYLKEMMPQPLVRFKQIILDEDRATYVPENAFPTGALRDLMRRNCQLKYEYCTFDQPAWELVFYEPELGSRQIQDVIDALKHLMIHFYASYNRYTEGQSIIVHSLPHFDDFHILARRIRLGLPGI